MCGIVGYVGKQEAIPILLGGLKQLEYRGYDSSGIGLWTDQGLNIIKKTGRVAVLTKAVEKLPLPCSTGIGHTRWATHGSVTEANTHPHISSDSKFSLVHNGVIENYQDIKDFLITKNYTFKSETDSEVLVNLIAYHYQKETEKNDKTAFFKSVRKSLLHVEGAYGIAVICADYPNQIIGARKGSPLVLGVGKDENMISSDISAFAGRTQQVVYLDDRQLVHLTDQDFSIITIAEERVAPVINEIDWKVEKAELGEFSHYMGKEIFEQPVTLENSMRGRFSDDGSTARFGGLNIEPRELRQIDRILLCGCGTAWHACLVGEHLIERFARIPVEVEYASEFRYRNAPLDKNTLVLVISQSGETIDTLEALREAKRKGYRTLAITNVVGSTIARESEGGIYQRVGLEIGVASTKAFTSQLLILSMLALYLGRLRDLSYSDGITMVKAFKKTPAFVRQILDQADNIKGIAEKYSHMQDFLFLGRQIMFPIALEGALKLKEISYIHAEGYPAAEMKHGPIALISPKCPTVFLTKEGEIFKKILANIQEIKSRKGPITVITSAGKNFPQNLADDVIHIPKTHECIESILATIPLQLLAYFIAESKGYDIDKPRNLAKSVTVE
jgi:glutamine---fructose-6-phosphate transaminase (isomerizing)